MSMKFLPVGNPPAGELHYSHQDNAMLSLFVIADVHCGGGNTVGKRALKFMRRIDTATGRPVIEDVENPFVHAFVVARVHEGDLAIRHFSCHPCREAAVRDC